MKPKVFQETEEQSKNLIHKMCANTLKKLHIKLKQVQLQYNSDIGQRICEIKPLQFEIQQIKLADIKLDLKEKLITLDKLYNTIVEFPLSCGQQYLYLSDFELQLNDNQIEGYVTEGESQHQQLIMPRKQSIKLLKKYFDFIKKIKQKNDLASNLSTVPMTQLVEIIEQDCQFQKFCLNIKADKQINKQNEQPNGPCSQLNQYDYKSNREESTISKTKIQQSLIKDTEILESSVLNKEKIYNYICKFCKKKLKQAVSYKNHLKKRHNHYIQYNCPICLFTSSWALRLTDHIMNEHRILNTFNSRKGGNNLLYYFICPYSQRMISKKKTLEAYIRNCQEYFDPKE